MDSLAAFFIVAVLIMMNGAVLGLMHRDLPMSLRPSAFSWRVGTLLQAGGAILLAVQRWLPQELVLPLGHGMLLLGVCGYWRALRQFYGFPESTWIFLPFLLGVGGMLWFTMVDPSQTARILLAAGLWAFIACGCIATLMAKRARDQARSRLVLIGVLAGVTLTIVACGLIFGMPGAIRQLIGASGWVNLIAPTIAAILPVIGTTAFLQLCSERIRREWERAASTDHLTGLANRRTLAYEGEQRLRMARRQGRQLSVAVIDIDHFKHINDRYGHAVGDEALKHVAERAAAACREVDLCSRQGGEEFVVLLDGVAGEAAWQAGERMRRAVESQPFLAERAMLPMTVSIGLAQLEADDLSLDDLLRRADRALYRAKAAGRNRIEPMRAVFAEIPAATVTSA